MPPFEIMGAPRQKEITLATACTAAQTQVPLKTEDRTSMKQISYLIVGKCTAYTQIIASYEVLKAKYCEHSRYLRSDAHIIAQQ